MIWASTSAMGKAELSSRRALADGGAARPLLPVQMQQTAAKPPRPRMDRQGYIERRPVATDQDSSRLGDAPLKEAPLMLRAR